MKKLILSLILALTALSPLSALSVNTAKAATTNTAIRGTNSSTVFWYANDGKRYVFPSAATYYTWFPTFNNVITISDSELFSIPIGGNVTYRPAAKLVKINTDPKVYAVARGGVLRHVTSELLAERLYGFDWRSDVHDIADVYFTNYTVGSPIYNESDFNVSNEYNGVFSPSDSLRGMNNNPGTSGDLVVNASRTSINPGEAVTLTVSNAFNYSSGYRIEIYDTRTNGLVRTCNLPASTCEVTVFPQRNVTENSVQYYAALRDVNSATVKSGYSPVIYFGGSQTGSLAVNVDRTTVTNGGSVVVSTSGNMPTGMYSLVLINEQTGATVATCYSMSCSQNVTVTGSNGQMIRFRAEARNSNGSVISTAYSSYVTVNGTQTGTLTLNANRTTVASGETITLTASGASTFNTARIVFINEQNGSIIANCYSVSSCSQNVMVTGYNGETVRFRAEARDWNGSIVATAYATVYVNSASGQTGTLTLNSNRSTLSYGQMATLTANYSNSMPVNGRLTINVGYDGRTSGGATLQTCYSNPCSVNISNFQSSNYTGRYNAQVSDTNGNMVAFTEITVAFTGSGSSNDGTNYINGLVLNADRTSINAGNLVRLTANAFHAGNWSYSGNRLEIWNVHTNQLVRTCYDVSTCTMDVYPQAQSSTNLTAQYQARIYDRNGNLAMSQYSAVIYLSSYNGSQSGTLTGSGFVSYAPTANLRPNQMVYITGTFSNVNLNMADAKVELYTENLSTPIATCVGAYTCSVSYPTNSNPMTTRVYARLSNRYNASQWLESSRVSMTTNW